MSTTTARPASRWATAVAGAKVIGGIYRDRALTAYAARVQKDPAARLGLAEYQADPYPIYDQIRTRGPLAPTRLGNLISATHAVCSEIVRSRSFVVFRPEQAADDPLPREMLDLSLLEMDPPEHTRLRRLVAPAFTPRRMAKYEILVAQRIGELLDAVDPHAGFDLVSEFAAPLPIAVISALLGVPDVDEKAFAAYGATLATALDGISSVGHLRRLLHAQSQLRQISPTSSSGAPLTPATTSSPRCSPSRTRRSRPPCSARCAGCCWSPGSRQPSTRSATASGRCWQTPISGRCWSRIPTERRRWSKKCSAMILRYR
jgi:hypothetical protein